MLIRIMNRTQQCQNKFLWIKMQNKKETFANLLKLFFVVPGQLCKNDEFNRLIIAYLMQKELNLKTNALATIFPKLSQNLQSVQLICFKFNLSKKSLPLQIRRISSEFYILSDGEVILEQICKNSTQIFGPILILTPVVFYGVQNLLKNQPYDNSAICITQKVTFYKFTYQSFLQLGDHYSKQALFSAERTCRRAPKIQTLQLIYNTMEQDEQNKQNPQKQRTIKSSGKHQGKFRKPITHIIQNQITFSNPVFSDLDAEKFKQIKRFKFSISNKLILKSNILHIIFRQNLQFAIKNYFKHNLQLRTTLNIEIPSMLDSIKKGKCKMLKFLHQQKKTQQIKNPCIPIQQLHKSHLKKSRF
ncbi:unnamed protein product [Paramecium sonneborni]|uniref:Cyclic nucleotide-binding domain-containing protein n=1 Tax=Paramecium sonneborni TaxID=65129 RepID=A0A8S1NTH7_9CILI|nr:unnamed protein product [Paramecium sonneborni]